MRLFVICAVACVVAVCSSACRQADGAMPVERGDDGNRIADISRDLANIAGGDPQGAMELADDLEVYTNSPEGQEATEQLARTLATALEKRPLTEDAGLKLARHVWATVAARELSERQVATLQTDMRGLLVSLGVPQASADAVAVQVSDTQRAVTDRRRRWYERY